MDRRQKERKWQLEGRKIQKGKRKRGTGTKKAEAERRQKDGKRQKECRDAETQRRKVWRNSEGHGYQNIHNTLTKCALHEICI